MKLESLSKIPLAIILGLGCGLVSMIFLFQTLPGKAPTWSLKIPADQIRPVELGGFEYVLPRWIGSSMITDVYQIHENGAPLEYLWPAELEYTPLPGTFHFLSGPSRLVFHPSDGKSPLLNQKTYEFEFPIISQKRSFYAALFFAIFAILLFSQQWIVGLPWNWSWYLVATGLLKIWMVADSEIVISMLDDAKNYSVLVVGNVWDTHDLIAHPGGFPAIAWIAAQLGIPWRLFQSPRPAKSPRR